MLIRDDPQTFFDRALSDLIDDLSLIRKCLNIKPPKSEEEHETFA